MIAKSTMERSTETPLVTKQSGVDTSRPMHDLEFQTKQERCGDFNGMSTQETLEILHRAHLGKRISMHSRPACSVACRAASEKVGATLGGLGDDDRKSQIKQWELQNHGGTM